MSDETQIAEILERVERATGADRELDALIRCAVFAQAGSYVKLSPINGAWCVYDSLRADGKDRGWQPMNITTLQRIGEFTRSIDAAMTLVPEGWNWMVGNRNQPNARAYVENGKSVFVGVGTKRNPERQWFEVVAATPALALTCAALRARIGGSNGG